MHQHSSTKTWVINFIFVLGIFFHTHIANADESNKQAPQPISAIVLDFELLGDTSLDDMQENDTRLVQSSSISLREKLQALKTLDVMDDKLALDTINSARQSRHLHRCNGCELTLARNLGANHVVVPWVFRMSILIQTMYIEVRDAETGNVIVHIGRNFRGNTDDGWKHAMDNLVQDVDAKLKHVEKQRILTSK